MIEAGIFDGDYALIRRADTALYRAKAAGRDRCEIDAADVASALQNTPPALKLVPQY